jgi:hypothetical protein
MQIAASFIEYLITGSITLLWLLPLIFGQNAFSSIKLSDHAFVLIPAAYVIGMLVDSVSKFVVDVLRRPKRTFLGVIRTLRVDLFRRKDNEGAREKSTSQTAFVVLHSTDLGKELQVRSSRDRIARGAFLNLLAIFVLVSGGFLTFPDHIVRNLGGFYGLLISLGITVPVSYIVWWRFARLTKRYKENSILVIKNKLAQEKERDDDH